jgi:hypothetical protein
MEIVEIKSLADAQAIDQFHEVATKVYQHDPVWVPESEMMFTQRFRAAQTQGKTSMVPVVALESDTPLARGAAIFVPSTMCQAGHPQGWIGFFECVQECPRAAGGVLEKCEQILRQAGVKSVLAPKVDNQLVGLLTKGFALPQAVFTNHNPPYYLEILQNGGYEVKTKIYTVQFTREMAEKVHVEIPGITTREFDRSNLTKEIAIFHKLQQIIFGSRPGYIPRALEEDREMVISFLPILEDDLVIIAEDEEKNPVGLLVCLPDVYQALRGQKVDRVRIMSIGVIPDLTHKGIGTLMGAHLMRNLLEKEYQIAEGSWVLETNVPPQNLARRFNAQPGREFVLLEKTL